MGKTIKIIGFILLGLSSLGLIGTFITLTTPDRTPVAETDHYQGMMADLDLAVASLPVLPAQQELWVGTARVSLLPEKPVPMAGYGARQGKLNEGVHDSIYVNCVWLQTGENRLVWVSIDMLIVPPTVQELLLGKLSDTGLSARELYLSATHTHGSLGAWAPGPTGEMFAGPYDPSVPEWITGRVLLAIAHAGENLQQASMGSVTIAAPQWVYNRLLPDKGAVDPLLRTLVFRRADGLKILITSYAAHPTLLGHGFMQYSRDYVGVLTDSLERHPDVAFAMFAAGAMGSHGPVETGDNDLESMQLMGEGLAGMLVARLDSLDQWKDVVALQTVRLPLRLGSPQVRVGEQVRMRPWLFYQIFRDYPAYLCAFRLGDWLMVGTPCDFSGELLPSLQAQAELQGFNLMVNSFNGGYIGYITPDAYYALDTYETRVMNWYGPGNGQYFQDMIARLMKIPGGKI
jgi:hypothetical protein